MKKCSEGCIPCCGYCKWAVCEEIELNGMKVSLAPFGCGFHSDVRHQRLAIRCEYCEDFTCKYCEEV